MAEMMKLTLSAERYDAVVQGKAGDGFRVLADYADPELIVKPGCTESGRAGACLTFTVEMPDGSRARVQTCVTAALLETAGMAVKGWREGGHIT